MKPKHSYKRGHPVALLVGFEQDHAVLWQVFSQVIKPYVTLRLAGTRKNGRSLYDLHESVIKALKPVLEEGVTSIVVTAPMKTTYAADFMSHVRKHHAYLIQSKGSNRATFAELVGSADLPHSVAELAKTKEFSESIAQTTSGEADYIITALEKSLSQTDSNRLVLFSLKEIEDKIYDREKRDDIGAAYLVLTDEYLAESKNKNRIQRLLQISANKKVKTRVIVADTPAGKRIKQFGGLIFFTMTTKP